MKLLTKNTIVFLLTTCVVFLAGGFIFYFQLQRIIEEETREELLYKSEEIKNYLETYHQLPNAVIFGELQISPSDTLMETKMIDTMIYHPIEEEEIPYQQLSFGVKHNGSFYNIMVRKSMLESDDLIETIILSFSIISGLFILLLMMVNYFFSKKMWQPFLKMVHQLSLYKVGHEHDLKNIKTNTKEFNQLQDAIRQMSNQISNDFRMLKDFTENASHEMQTPLAIIKNKTENILQTEGLNADQIKHLLEIEQTANRLRKLNQNLLLLTKIENHQFNHQESNHLSEIVKHKWEQYEELAGLKNIQADIQIEDHVMIQTNPTLVDIILSNLFSNAIRYNHAAGKISIRLTENTLQVCNSGKNEALDAEKIFQRFYKDHEHPDSIGLGLSIVKEITEIQRHQISYRYINQMHCFTYQF